MDGRILSDFDYEMKQYRKPDAAKDARNGEPLKRTEGLMATTILIWVSGHHEFVASEDRPLRIACPGTADAAGKAGGSISS
jgi:hypothetical protein